MRNRPHLRPQIGPFALLTAVLALTLPTMALAKSGLVSNVEAERNGLTRAWFSQAELDPAQHRVERAVLSGGDVFVLTTAGVLHAMDAETGATRWVVRIGNPDHPSLGPAANALFVALVNGNTIHVLDRENGMEIMSRPLGGGAGGGPAISEEYVYVPLFSGKIEAFPIGDAKKSVWYYASAGRSFRSATRTQDSVVWPTERGYLYVANPGGNGVRYRFETSGLVNSHPVSYNGLLLTSSSNGFVYGIDEMTGQQRWRYASGSGMHRSPVAIDGVAYIASEQPALHAIDAATGKGLWKTPGVWQLLGVGKTRAYGLTRMGDIMVLDTKSGVPLGSLRTSPETTAIVNPTTDRLYLVNETGLVQCLHEIGADAPLIHTAPAAPAEGDAAAPVEDGAEPAEPAQPAEGNPFGEPADDASPFGGEETEDPFDGGAEPAGEPEAEPAADDPFAEGADDGEAGSFEF
ncbi:outer membrane protein assembly factor BamB family protein [Aeoliella sp. SH292]|uniref:PQQ-binding-like beta-propeller repeat protein n=1 Tax=Aeoliella sp. SH292 TaxID=3454464 RepID=UPI003F951EE6